MGLGAWPNVCKANPLRTTVEPSLSTSHGLLTVLIQILGPLSYLQPPK